MKKRILVQAMSAALLIPAHAILASDVTGLTTFSAGTPAVASQVNGNFTAVKTAVDNNHVRITTLESGAASPNITGNITLPNSTTTTGNIIKGTTPFLHNFGTGNTFLGADAGNFTMTGISNTASGIQALQSNTTGVANTASGIQALQNNTTGGGNTASGSFALQSNTTGNNNTASGQQALNRNTTGSGNTASGLSALNENTTGNENTASGFVALGSNTTGNYNTASGVSALSSNTTGNYNTASGRSALQHNTTGSSNIAIGYGAGLNLTTGDGNIDIDNQGVASEANTIRIGTSQTRAFIAGIRGVTTATAAIAVVVDSNGQLGTLSSSRRVKDDIADMGDTSSVLKQLRPVTFHYKSDQNPKGRSLQYGLIAEEVEKVAPNLVARSANGEIETVFYQHLAPMLLNEFQKQQRTIETQTAALAKQTERLAALELERRLQTARIEMLEKQTALMTAVLGRMERAALLTAAGRW